MDVMDAVAPATDELPPTRRVRVILNPSSGSKLGVSTNQGAEDEVRAAMAKHDLGDELVISESPEHAIEVTREAVAAGYDAVVAAGGDGTVGMVAHELVGKRTALGVLPLGSVMNVARSLDIPREVDGAAAVIAAGHVRAIDIGEADGTFFLEGGSIGLTAVVFSEAQRADDERITALGSAVRAFVKHRPFRARIRLDHATVTTSALAITVSNGPYTGIAYTVAPEAKMDDGLLDVAVFRHQSRWSLVRHFAAIAFGRETYAPEVLRFQSSKVRVEARHTQPVRVDSHDIGRTPMEFQACHGALRVLAPPPAP